MVPVHILDIAFAEISAVQDKADFTVSIVPDLVCHESELGDIRYGTRILLIEQGDPVRLVKSDRQVEYRKSFFVFGFSELDQVDISCLAVLVGGIIGKINALFMVPFVIPVGKEAQCLFLSNGCKEPADNRSSSPLRTTDVNSQNFG